MYRDMIPIAPPSPIKKARVEAAKGRSTIDNQAQARFQQHNYDRYEMFTGDPADNPPLPPPPRPGRKGIFSVRNPSLFFLFFLFLQAVPF
jgi:hypothetical protein